VMTTRAQVLCVTGLYTLREHSFRGNLEVERLDFRCHPAVAVKTTSRGPTEVPVKKDKSIYTHMIPMLGVYNSGKTFVE